MTPNCSMAFSRVNLIDLCRKWFGKWFCQAGLIAVVVALTYGHTLDVPFYLDDYSSIVENPTIYLWKGSLGELWRFNPSRVVGYLTFALDYKVHQSQPAGYHLVNIFIHILVGCAVLGLFRGLVHAPRLALMREGAKRWLPIIAALFFVLHPLQIQAVTYIVQRLACLSALFYIGALACYVQTRLSRTWGQRWLWVLACGILTVLAFFTKQNTVTLPLAIILVEIVFFPLDKRRLIGMGLAVALIFILLWAVYTQAFHYDPFSLQTLTTMTRETTNISRTSYLATQMNVLWTYLRLFFLPASAHIDYDYPIAEGFLNTANHSGIFIRIVSSSTFWAFLGHLAMLGLAAYTLRRRPFISFGLFFYYLAHSIESGTIPIKDVVFIHRTYLPNLGLIMVCGWLLVVELPRWLRIMCDRVTLALSRGTPESAEGIADPSYVKKIPGESISQMAKLIDSLPRLLTGYLVIMALAAMGLATWSRNQMWRVPVALWQHNVKLSPLKQRGWTILGMYLTQQGRPLEAIEALRHAVSKNQNPDGTYCLALTPETALNLVVANKELHHFDEALAWIDLTLRNASLQPINRSKLLVNLGDIFFMLGKIGEAETAYRQAVQACSECLPAQFRLAGFLNAIGRTDEAKDIYQELIKIIPNDAFLKRELQKHK